MATPHSPTPIGPPSHSSWMRMSLRGCHDYQKASRPHIDLSVRIFVHGPTILDIYPHPLQLYHTPSPNSSFCSLAHYIYISPHPLPPSLSLSVYIHLAHSPPRRYIHTTPHLSTCLNVQSTSRHVYRRCMHDICVMSPPMRGYKLTEWLRPPYCMCLSMH